MKGAEITDCDTLVVEGPPRSNARHAGAADRRERRVQRRRIRRCRGIRGRLDGELTARKQLILHATARVSGKIRYNRIQVSEGAEISGEIEILDRSQSASTVRTGSAAFAAQRPAS
jgi:hypothetical protein